MTKIDITEYAGTDKHLKPEDYERACATQSACNLSGIVKWLAVVLDKIWQEAHERRKGTDWVNQHPICVLLAEQIVHLSCGAHNKAYYDAANYCEERRPKL
jgi:hypothetical protein